MSNDIRILLPVLPSMKGIYIKGYVNVQDDYKIIIYITKFSDNSNILSEKPSNADTAIYGYVGYNSSKKMPYQNKNFITIVQNKILRIKKLIIDGNEISNTNNCIIMVYDHDNIKDTETLCVLNNEYISKLVNYVRDEEGQMSDDKAVFRYPEWMGNSMFLQHVSNYWRLFQWLISIFKRDFNVSIKQGNLILAILLDLLLGYIVLQLLPQDKEIISSGLMEVLEKLINLLYSLLKWLMGAPVGLKLNNAFNKMLGKYFSYHVQLWWLFLDVSGEKLHIILDIYYYIGYLGLTFQIAIISDLICLATFHSYCIYVYAARLFNIQISGLIALLRLFVGRKYNPLRGGIDSCEYNNQELFVGTVAFTVLLLLLPTTALYYVVFTVFRVLSLAVQNILAKLIYLVQTSPLYVTFLWLTSSPKVRGNILIEVMNEDVNSPLLLRIKLFNKSISELLSLFKPPVDIPKQVQWTNLFSNIFIGKQIV